MKTPKVKDSGTPRKPGTPSSKKDNANLTAKTPGMMTRSQLKRFSVIKNSPQTEAKNTPVKSSQKPGAVHTSPIKSVRRSLRSGVSSNVTVPSKKKKKEDVEDSDNNDLINTVIEENIKDTLKSRPSRHSKVVKKLEDAMSDKCDEVKKVPSPEIRVSLDKCPLNFNENKSSPNTNKRCITRSARSVSKKLENDTSGKDNESKQIKSVGSREGIDEHAKTLNKSEPSQSLNKEGKTRSLKRSISRKLENDTSDENNKPNQLKSPQSRKVINEHTEILNENESTPSKNKESNSKSESKKCENVRDNGNKDLRIKSPQHTKPLDKCSDILDENKLSPKRNKEGKTETRSVSKKLENDMNKDDNESKKVKSPDIRKDEYLEIFNDAELSPKADKEKAKLKSICEKVEDDKIDEHNETKEMKTPEVMKDTDENPKILCDSDSTPKNSKEKTKSKRNISKKLPDGKNDNVSKEIKSPEITKEIDEYPEILYDNKSSPERTIDKTKPKRSISKNLEIDKSDEVNEIISPEIGKAIEEYPEILYDSKSPELGKDGTKSRRNIFQKLEDDKSNEDNETTQVKSPEVMEDKEESLEILFDGMSSPRTSKGKKSKRRVSKKLENNTSDENNEVQQIKSPEIGKDTDEFTEIVFDRKSSPKKCKDKNKSKRILLSPTKKIETSNFIEISDSDSENEIEKVKTSGRKASKQQIIDIEGHMSLDTSEAETIIFKNNLEKIGKTLPISKIKSCPEENQVIAQKNIADSPEEISISDDEIIACNSTKKEKIPSVSPQKPRLLSEKLGSSEKIEDKNLSSKNKISSPRTKRLSKSSELPSLSPSFRNQSKEELRSESSESDSDAESRKAIKESAQKRIIQSLSTSESDSKKFMRPVTKFYDINSDSESAAEEMSLSAGHQLEMDSLKNAMESINKDKQRRKERRRQLLEKYKQQKEEKLIRLKEKRASQEDASCSSSEESGYEEDGVPVALGKSKKKQRTKLEKENVDDPVKGKTKKLNVSGDEAETKDRKEKKRKHEQMEVPQNVGNLRELPSDVLEYLPDQIPIKAPKLDKEASSVDKQKSSKLDSVKNKKQDFRSCSDIDYIPLSSCGSTEFGVIPLETFSRSSKSMAEQAADFRQRMLYGSHIKRAPANAHLIYQQKLKASGRDRFAR